MANPQYVFTTQPVPPPPPMYYDPNQSVQYQQQNMSPAQQTQALSAVTTCDVLSRTKFTLFSHPTKQPQHIS